MGHDSQLIAPKPIKVLASPKIYFNPQYNPFESCFESSVNTT